MKKLRIFACRYFVVIGLMFCIALSFMGLAPMANAMPTLDCQTQVVDHSTSGRIWGDPINYQFTVHKLSTVPGTQMYLRGFQSASAVSLQKYLDALVRACPNMQGPSGVNPNLYLWGATADGTTASVMGLNVQYQYIMSKIKGDSTAQNPALAASQSWTGQYSSPTSDPMNDQWPLVSHGYVDNYYSNMRHKAFLFGIFIVTCLLLLIAFYVLFRSRRTQNEAKAAVKRARRQVDITLQQLLLGSLDSPSELEVSLRAQTLVEMLHPNHGQNLAQEAKRVHVLANQAVSLAQDANSMKAKPTWKTFEDAPLYVRVMYFLFFAGTQLKFALRFHVVQKYRAEKAVFGAALGELNTAQAAVTKLQVRCDKLQHAIDTAPMMFAELKTLMMRLDQSRIDLEAAGHVVPLADQMEAARLMSCAEVALAENRFSAAHEQLRRALRFARYVEYAFSTLPARALYVPEQYAELTVTHSRSLGEIGWLKSELKRSHRKFAESCTTELDELGTQAESVLDASGIELDQASKYIAGQDWQLAEECLSRSESALTDFATYGTLFYTHLKLLAELQSKLGNDLTEAGQLMEVTLSYVARKMFGREKAMRIAQAANRQFAQAAVMLQAPRPDYLEINAVIEECVAELNSVNPGPARKAKFTLMST